MQRMLINILFGILIICFTYNDGCMGDYLLPPQSVAESKVEIEDSVAATKKPDENMWESGKSGKRKYNQNLQMSQTKDALRQKLRDQNLTNFLDSMLVGYDQRIRPNNNGPPVLTTFQIYVNQFYGLHQENMDYKINIFLRLRWNDPRLAHNFAEKEILLDPSILGEIWKPDVYFSNEKRANFHVITTDNKLVRLYRNGDIYSGIRLTLTLSCNMHLRHFPMDVQICSIKMESFGYDMTSLIFDWNADNAVKLPETLQLPQFLIRGYRVEKCTKKYDTGSFTCLVAHFILERQMGYYFIQMYAPSVLIVILSWVAFWINMDAAPARTALGITTVLTMTTESSGARASLPKVSYVKAIDVWYAVCLLFVFAALLEFALVNFLSRKAGSFCRPIERCFHFITPSEDCERKGRQAQTTNRILACEMVCLQYVVEESTRKSKEKRIEEPTPDVAPELTPKEKDRAINRKRAKQIDNIARFLFPISFIIFNSFYWVVYQVARDDLATAMENATLYFH